MIRLCNPIYYPLHFNTSNLCLFVIPNSLLSTSAKLTLVLSRSLPPWHPSFLLNTMHAKCEPTIALAMAFWESLLLFLRTQATSSTHKQNAKYSNSNRNTMSTSDHDDQGSASNASTMSDNIISNAMPVATVQQHGQYREGKKTFNKNTLCDRTDNGENERMTWCWQWSWWRTCWHHQCC